MAAVAALLLPRTGRKPKERTVCWPARLSSLEGCTVSNRGQRPRKATTPQCQPGGLYAREDGGASRSAEGARYVDAVTDPIYLF